VETIPNSRLEAERAQIERRTRPRYSFLAVVELSEVVGVYCVEGRIREISRKGCYVNTPSTLPIDTALTVVISRDDENFETIGKVIYVHEHVGMGVLFENTNDEQLETLNSWLATLSGNELS
jgi:hypothetical protein